MKPLGKWKIENLCERRIFTRSYEDIEFRDG